ncbi:MAG: NAD(P)-dependent oxidoreductase [Actinobacteria bacterium]|nr:NAD(P)-dependent oxidoreductase [Actinomycetota bacterium]MBO0786177.1 NAD(P)-dependent oxidoreductase [Actinomycetota bacterium]MBO0816515.1 NAD(P)-dependent oxidoreductase [Actinomycetota bacterium]
MTAVGPVAVLGAGGIMGFPMARNLARAGLEVRAWNRSRQKAGPLAGDGVRIDDTPAGAARDADIVLTMLADTNALISAMDGTGGALSALAPAAVWLQMGTIGEEGTEHCARLAADQGIAFADAPVLGTRQPAEQGKLVILGSGPDAVRSRVQPLLDVLGTRTIWVGEAGAGTRLKLVTNSWVLAVVEAGAETIALAEGLGLDPALLFEALAGGALDLPYLRLKGEAMTNRDFRPSFRLRVAAKDAELIGDAAERRGLDLPLLATIAQRLAEGARQHGDADFSATFLTSAPRRAA